MSVDTRERLIRAAATEVSLHGIRGASMRGVAARAGLKAASIFHHFPNGKDQLMDAMFAHIMQTIATRMTPSIQASSTLAPRHRIVQSAALLWDFMAEHPEYAGALMREALGPEARVVQAVSDRAEAVVELAVAYLDACQSAGELPELDSRRFLLRLASYTMTFHAAPSVYQAILGPDTRPDVEREAFLEELGQQLAEP